MSDVTRTIHAAIKSELAAELTGYRELAYVNDVKVNSFRQAGDSYGVRPGSAEEVPGVTRFITIRQTYEILLAATYPLDRVGDSAAVDRALDLYESIHAVHTRLTANRCGAPSSVMNVTGLKIDEPEYDTDEKTIVVRARLDVTYRVQI